MISKLFNHNEPCSMSVATRSITASSLFLSGRYATFMFMPKNRPNVCQNPARKEPRKALTILYDDWFVSLLMSLRSILPCDFVNPFITGL